MNTFKTRALILREYEAGESDKRLILLCKGHGRLTVYARGARKVKSKFLAASQMLTYGDYVLADGRQFYSLCQAEVIENFYPIRQDYDLLCHAQKILDICEKRLPERTPCDDTLLLTLKTLQHISKGQKDPRQAEAVFLFRFFLLSGLAPEMNECCVCGANTDKIFCDEGLICANCRINKATMPLSSGAIEAITHILSNELNTAFMFQVNDSVLKELTKAAQLCWLGHFAGYH